MKTKEAIEFLEHNDGVNFNWRGNFKYIVALLKRGEKYEKMWGEVVRYFSYMEWKDEIIEKIKQKYFPKEVKK